MQKVTLLDSWKIGHPAIDRDHEQIVEIINDVTDAIADERYGICQELLNAFLQAVEDHFRREEAILEAIKYPDRKSHAYYHGKLIERAHGVKRLCDEAVNKNSLSDCFEEMVSFLIDDIIVGDLVFKSYLSEHSENRI